jgi:hypothetical protein
MSLSQNICKLERQRLAQEEGKVSYLLDSPATSSSVDDEGLYKEFNIGLVGVMYFGGSAPASVPAKYSKQVIEMMV